MLQFFQNGGIFMFIILALGVTTLTFGIRNLAQDKNFTALTFSLLVATCLVGILGTGIGLHEAAMALPKMTSAQLGKVIGIAATNITFAAILSFPSAILLGLAQHRKAKSTA